MPRFSYPATLKLNQESLNITVWATQRMYQKTTQRHLNHDAQLGTLRIVSIHHHEKQLVFSDLPVLEQIKIRHAGWDYLLKKLS